LLFGFTKRIVGRRACGAIWGFALQHLAFGVIAVFVCQVLNHPGDAARAHFFEHAAHGVVTAGGFIRQKASALSVHWLGFWLGN